jgi:D-alanine transfer protein
VEFKRFKVISGGQLSVMKQPKWGPIFLALGIFIIFMIPFVLYVNRQINKSVSVENLAPNLDDRKYDGLVIEEKALATNKFFYIFDSSNLSNTDSPYHPSSLFKRKKGFIPYLVGESGLSTIHHILKIVDLGHSIRGQKIVFLVEPLYFITDNPHSYLIDRGFSPLHVYYFIFESQMNRKLKSEIAKSLLKSEKFYGDPVLMCLLRNLSKKNPNKSIKELIEPIGYGIFNFLEQIDRINAYQLIIAHQSAYKPNVPNRALNWNDLMKRAEKDGQKACQSNNFSIDDFRYNEHIRYHLNSSRNEAKNKKYLSLEQIQDFQLLLDVCKEFNLKPLFIIMPVNGFWYDYTGLPKKVRYQFRNQITQMIQKAGFEYADFSSHEYEKYFLRDTKHIGWKGWVYIDQAMDRFYHQ